MSTNINIICLSGTREKLQMAAMVASVGAASGDNVTVFFSMNALQYFVKGQEGEAPVEGEFGKLLSHKGVPPFKQLFQQAAELGESHFAGQPGVVRIATARGVNAAPSAGVERGESLFDNGFRPVADVAQQGGLAYNLIIHGPTGRLGRHGIPPEVVTSTLDNR